MESLDEQEIQSIWERVKKYVEIKDIKGVTKTQFQEQIKQKMESVEDRGKNSQANMDFLIRKGFVKRALDTPSIQKELYSTEIRTVEVRGGTRFQVAKGTPTTTINGKQVRAGQFLSGKTKEEAVKNLQEKAKE